MEKCPKCGSKELSLVYREEVVWPFILKPEGDWAWGEPEVLRAVPGELVVIGCSVCNHECPLTPELKEFFHSKTGFDPDDVVPLTLYEESIGKVRGIRDAILEFDAACAQAEYTDVGTVWELLGRWKEDLTAVLGDADEVAKRVCSECGTLPIAVDEDDNGEPIVACPNCYRQSSKD